MITKVSFVFKPVTDILLMFVGPIIIGGYIYYWLRPIVRKLSKGRFKKYKGLISIVVILLFISVFVVIISSLGVNLKSEFEKVILKESSSDKYLQGAKDYLDKLNIDSSYLNKYFDQFKEWINNLLKNVPGMFSEVGNFFTQLILVPFVLFYLLKEEDEIKVEIEKILPENHKKEEINLLKKLDSVLQTYIVGQLLVALIIGILMFIGYLFIKMPNALLMASFSVITAVIPLIGAFLGIVPALFISLTIGIDMFIKIIILSVIVQQLEGNLITPNLMGSRLNIHPFVIMAVVIISINLLGLFGGFIGIPLYLVISILLKEVYKTRKKEKI